MESDWGKKSCESQAILLWLGQAQGNFCNKSKSTSETRTQVSYLHTPPPTGL